MFSRTISGEFMPESTQVTSLWSQSQRKPHSAGERFGSWAAKSFLASGGSALASLPPRSGSMMITAKPLPAAYFRPVRPAWECSSR